jgi:hypothetical protein
LYLGISGAYPLFQDGKKMWENLLVDGYDILRPGGKIIIPTTKDIIPLPQARTFKGRFHLIVDSSPQQIQNVERIIRDFAPNLWRVEYMAAHTFILSDKPERATDYPVLILEKV